MTWLLKSACSLAMIPETWLPTATVVTAERAPVAVTVCVTVPRSAFAVRYFGSDLLRPPDEKEHAGDRRDRHDDPERASFLHGLLKRRRGAGCSRCAGQPGAIGVPGGAGRARPSQPSVPQAARRPRPRGARRTGTSRARRAHVPHRAPLDGARSPMQPDPDDRAGGDVRRRDRQAERGSEPDEQARHRLAENPSVGDMGVTRQARVSVTRKPATRLPRAHGQRDAGKQGEGARTRGRPMRRCRAPRSWACR